MASPRSPPRRCIDGPALLLMCDHLVEPALYARMAASDPGDGLKLGIDRRLGHRGSIRST